MRAFIRFIACTALFAALCAPAFAQSTSSVSGPDVKDGEDLFEYRIAFSPENDGKEEGFAHRLHYQHGFSDSFRGRIFIVQSKRGAEALKTRSITIELQEQFVESEDSGGWDSSFRVEGIIPTEKAPGRARISWLNGWEIGHHVELRGNIYFNRSFGDNAAKGISLETREEALVRVSPTVKLGAQMFNYYNTTANFGTFDEQRHQAGPIIKGKLGKHVKYEISALVGLSAAASDLDTRLFVSYSF